MEWHTFDPVSTEQWWQQIEKDLKGKPTDALWWEVEPGLSASPLYHADTADETGRIVVPPPHYSPWQVAESYAPVPQLNSLLLEGLEGGVQVPVLRLPTDLTPDLWASWLAGVQTEYITTVVHGPYSEHHRQVLCEHPVSQSAGCWVHDAPPEPAVFRALASAMPKWRFVNVIAPADASPSEQVTDVLLQYDRIAAMYAEAGIPAAQWHAHTILGVRTGDRYFVEIAKLRAMRYLLAQLAALHGADATAPLTMAATMPDYSPDHDPHDNMIAATTHTMAAALGGADIILTLPATVPADTFHRRIARNVQHLLQWESYLHRVHDPAAGSYAIEALSVAIARRAWERFQQS